MFLIQYPAFQHVSGTLSCITTCSSYSVLHFSMFLVHYPALQHVPHTVSCISKMYQIHCLAFNHVPANMSQLFILVGWGRSFVSIAWPTGVQLVFSLLRVSVSYSAPRDLHRRALTESVVSSFLIHQGDYHVLFVCP